MKIQHIGKAVSRNTVGVARSSISIDQTWLTELQTRIIITADTNKNTGRGTRQSCGVLPGVLQGLPGNFQQEALLGIHTRRFPR